MKKHQQDPEYGGKATEFRTIFRADSHDAGYEEKDLCNLVDDGSQCLSRAIYDDEEAEKTRNRGRPNMSFGLLFVCSISFQGLQ